MFIATGESSKMGYTHSWKVLDTARWSVIWPQLVMDAIEIIKTAGVPLNGMSRSYVKENYESSENAGKRTGNRDSESGCKSLGEEDNVDDSDHLDEELGLLRLSVERGIYINGKGSDSHEPFFLHKNGTDFDFCKTARKPYDLVVATILIRAKMLAGRAFHLSSDGVWDFDGEWIYAAELYSKLWDDELSSDVLGLEREKDD